MVLNTATIMPKGQITLPADICKNMKLTPGDRVVLIYDNDRVVMMNPARYAMETLQKEMEGEAEKAGLTTEDDIINLCREIRIEVEGT
jgi:AbrB family looped-hinge helix DNA binding protein